MIKHLRNFLILMPFVSCISQSNGQLNKKQVTDDARIYFESLVKQNWDEYQKHTPPKLFELLGGVENAKNYITTQWNADNKKGSRLKNIVIDSCTNITQYKEEYQCSLLASFEYQTDSTITMIHSTLIAFTNDKGKHWYYLDTYGKAIDEVYSYFPNISKKLTIFKKEEPIVTKKR